ncbi:hypothetical protein [Pedobacter boryungensis]|uniref:Uncharacterized protein n=1 Tax=Pedobacter boryungensis TaxID=869962 RepID=A0ABX2DE75_9SPHI|nr:hypothetical protein [Pedobacter boryungensis]NQX31271.1 hypothetical protein [Pedobacter boryungensis]
MKTAQTVMATNNDNLLKSLLFDNEAATRRVNNSRSEKEAKKQRIEIKLKKPDTYNSTFLK